MTDLKTKMENVKAPTRKGSECTAKFEVPAKAKKSGAKDDTRVTGVDMRWVFDADPKTKGIKKGKGDVIASDSSKKNTVKSDTEKLPRKQFHPYAGKPVLKTIEFWVRGYNTQNSKKHYGPWKHKSLKVKKPDKPKSVTLTYTATGTNGGKVTPGYTSEHPDGAKEVYSTQVWCYVDKATSKLYDGVEYKDVTKTLTPVAVSGATTLGIGAFKKVIAEARNRGLGGNSEKVSKTTYICHPNPPTCDEPEIVYATPNTLATASVRVPITVNPVMDGKTAIRPTTVKLQRLKNSTSENDPASAAASSGWTDVTDGSGSISGLTDTWANAHSDDDKYTWYRAVSIRDGYTVQGVPRRAKRLDSLSSSTTAGVAYISALSSEADGHSVKLTLAGKQADDEGYEVSWSTEKDAWSSTKPPETFTTTGSTITVKDLEESVRYYFRARAYDLDSEGSFVFGQYSSIYEKTPYSTPNSVALSCPQTVERGKDVQYTWTYDTDAQQTAWKLVDDSGKIAYDGDGSACAYAVTAEQYGDASSLTYHVEMTTGGGWAKSATRTVNIADAPTCSVSASATLAAQPLSISVSSDSGDRARVSVTALGTSGTGLYGDREQFAGDTVFSGEFAPAYSNGSATVTLPRGLAFHNGADYRIDVTTIDTSTGLESEPQSAGFSVSWSRTATQPTGSITVDATSKWATVTISAPTGVAVGDVFDLYRVTPDGERRIAENQPFGTVITDKLAPYTHNGANLRYFAVTKTVDGDTCISDDIEYSLPCKALRFDWGGDSYVELPYNLKLEDEFSKDSEVRKHMDGTSQAYWNDGVTRKSSLATDVIRLDQQQQALVRDMLQHAGSVFVRTPDGMAYSADVQPGTIERSCGTSAMGMSFKATEHDLTDEGRPAEADIVQPAYSGGSLTSIGGTVYDNTGKYPLYDWRSIGYNNSTLYVYDPESKVRNGSGTVQTNWTWDGDVLKNAQGTVIDVTGD